MSSIEEIIDRLERKRGLVIGIGGGGDVVATLPTVHYLRNLGLEVIIGSSTWERFVIDPEPGPRSLNEIENIVRVSETTALANEKTRSKGGVVFQGSKLAGAIGEDVLFIDLTKGVRGLVLGLEETLRKYNIRIVLGIDGGGDVLAKGDEEHLRSPLADMMMLSALAQLEAISIIGVFGFGSDGELSTKEILDRLSEVAEAGGYLGARGMTPADVEMMERALGEIFTEASRIPLMSAKGFLGSTTIRDGTRKVFASILSTITFYLDTRILYELRPMAQRIRDTESIWEVNEALHEYGLNTELDLEVEAKRRKAKSYRDLEE